MARRKTAEGPEIVQSLEAMLQLLEWQEQLVYSMLDRVQGSSRAKGKQQRPIRKQARKKTRAPRKDST